MEMEDVDDEVEEMEVDGKEVDVGGGGKDSVGVGRELKVLGYGDFSSTVNPLGSRFGGPRGNGPRGRHEGRTEKEPNSGTGLSGPQPQPTLGPFDFGDPEPDAPPAATAPKTRGALAKKRGRPGKKVFSEAVYDALDECFEENTSPKPNELKEIAVRLGAHYLKVQTWFRTRRRNVKKKRDDASGRSATPAVPTAGTESWTDHEFNRFVVAVGKV